MINSGLILLAEDDENDAFLFKVALQKAEVACPLIIATDGQDAINYLGGLEPYTDRVRFPLPTLLLLDLKMPRVNGFEVLAWIQARPELQTMPVVVLSSSAVQSDIQRARGLGASDYQVKPQEFVELLKIVQELKQRWLEKAAVS